MIGSRFLIRSAGAVAVAVAAAACGGGGDDGGNRDKAGGSGAPAAVRIVNFRFEPPELTVKPGTTVTWTNDDTAVHSIKDTSSLATPVSPDLGLVLGKPLDEQGFLPSFETADGALDPAKFPAA